MDFARQVDIKGRLRQRTLEEMDTKALRERLELLELWGVARVVLWRNRCPEEPLCHRGVLARALPTLGAEVAEAAVKEGQPVCD